jgi:hypothetical protein
MKARLLDEAQYYSQLAPEIAGYTVQTLRWTSFPEGDLGVALARSFSQKTMLELRSTNRIHFWRNCQISTFPLPIKHIHDPLSRLYVLQIGCGELLSQLIIGNLLSFVAVACDYQSFLARLVDDDGRVFRKVTLGWRLPGLSLKKRLKILSMILVALPKMPATAAISASGM